MTKQTRQTERRMTNDERFDRFLLWTMAVSVFTLMLCVYVLSPLAYVWALGLAGCGLSVFGSLVVAGSLATSGSILDTYFAVQIVKGGFELAGVILQGLAGLSSSNS